MNILRKCLIITALLFSQAIFAGGYEPFMGNSIVVRPFEPHFDGFVVGAAYSFIDGTFRTKNTDIFNPSNPPPIRQEKDAHLDAVDVYVGYGQQVSRFIYTGIRGGAQLYTQSNVDLFRDFPPIANSKLKDKYRARQSGFVDLIPGLVMEDRFMLYPFFGFSNTKYVYQGTLLEQGEPALEYRNQEKWGKAYRLGIGAKFAFFKALSMDINVVHQAPYHVTWPALGRVTETPPNDPFKHSLQPTSNMLTIGFEGYIN